MTAELTSRGAAAGARLPTLAGEAGCWAPAPGVTSLGPVQDSGLTHVAFLVRRADGQIVQLSELLHLVLAQLGTGRDRVEVADAVSEAFGRRLTPEGLDHLVRTKLVPAGLAVDTSAAVPPPPPPRAKPLLALRLKVTLLPASAVRRVATAIAPLFWRPVVAMALAALVGLDVTLLARGDLLRSLGPTLADPGALAALYALLLLGILVHELGHAAACHYGGARPGPIGAGLYVVFPAFYTEVSDSYRLDRAGRLRTDLGGLYLNVWCLLVAGGAYLATDEPMLLVLVAVMHAQAAQQLLPTLRFDGYYVLADLAGVPDLFARVRPVLTSLLPGRPTHPRVAELRPAARRLVVGWVVVVVPLLAALVVWLMWSSPVIVATAADAVALHARAAGEGWADGDVLLTAVSAAALVMVVLPVLGLAAVALSLLRAVAAGTRAVARRSARSGYLSRTRAGRLLRARRRPRRRPAPAHAARAPYLTRTRRARPAHTLRGSRARNPGDEREEPRR